jgi:tRNA A-37 threonylcarbamoyl transferase component Bud32
MPEKLPPEFKQPQKVEIKLVEPESERLEDSSQIANGAWRQHLMKPLPPRADRLEILNFLAEESKENLLWNVVYEETMKQHNITQQEVLQQWQPRKSKELPWPTRHPPKEVPEEVVIYCWPYHAEAPDGGFSMKNHNTYDPVVAIVTIFGAIWILASLAMVGEKFYGGGFYFFKLIPLVLLPVLGAIKGLTHLRVTSSGLVFQSVSGKSNLRSKTLKWNQIKRVYAEIPAGKSALTGKMIVALKDGGKHIIALKKIASGTQWRSLVEGMQRYIDVSELNPGLLDGINDSGSRDPSYTKLWLDALAAPPKRERLQPLAPGVELQKGKYKIEKLLGSGGQGSAYLAADGTTTVVLKEYILPVYVDVKVRRSALEDFEHEARMLGSLHHKGIVKNFSSFIEDHRAYLVLEYVQGKSLRDLVREQGALPEAQCTRYGIEMCDILSYLHSQSPPVVHQDFTPDNLLVAPDGSLKLIDFMVAKEASDSASSAIVGKHHYMPPEQFRGKATPRSDIYALGCSLFFLLTGAEPEPMSTSHPTLQNNQVSGAVNSIVERATALDQFSRYDSARALRADLEKAQEESGRCEVDDWDQLQAKTGQSQVG